MSREKIGFGIIGLGLIVEYGHAPAFQSARAQADIVAVCDLDAAKAQRWAARYGAQAYADYAELLLDARVDAVDIALPHNLHYPVAKAALEQKKHAIVEKPLALRSDQCKELIDRANAANVKITVAENTRFVKAYLEAERLLRENVLGQPRLIRTFISGSEVFPLAQESSWKRSLIGSGGGVIADAAPHSFYLLKWLFGEIDELQAVQFKSIEGSEVEDNAVVLGRLKSGALFTTEYTFTAESPWDERLEIYGSKGALIVDQLGNPPAILYRGSADAHGTPLDEVPYDPLGWKRTSIAAGIADFIDAIWEDRPPTVDPMDGYYAVRMVENAYEAAAAPGKVRA